MLNEQKVLEANEKFYNAFNSRDLELMKDVWLEVPSATCLHPGWHLLKGYGPIIQSWDNIFQSGGNQDIKLSDVEVTASQDLAWVSCRENLFSITASGVQLSGIHATNVFRLTNGAWKMLLHHASTIPSLPSE